MISCSLSLFNNFRQAENNTDSGNEFFSWFQGEKEHFLFQATIDVFRNHYSGLMFIKPLPGNNHRVLFINKLGIKIFDLELSGNDEFKMHYCLEKLNKKSVIKILRNDIGLMLKNISVNGKTKLLTERRTGRMIIKSKDETGITYFFMNNKTKKVDQLIQSGSLMKKLKMCFYTSDGIEADSIDISHFIIKLNIHLIKLNETKSDISE